MMETVLQFGAGRFLRGFIDRFISDLNQAGHEVGRILVVQSTAGQRAELLNRASDGFPVAIRGLYNGEPVDREHQVDSISRAVVADTEWHEVLDFITTKACRLIVTNATEAGYELCERANRVPPTLSGKLAVVLRARFEFEREGRSFPPLTILPCELIPRNADRLRELVCQQLSMWGEPQEAIDYVRESCLWLNNLVDCIVSDLPDDDPRRMANPLAIMAEPYALLAIEKPSGFASNQSEWVLKQLVNHPAVQLVDDLEPFYRRKVRVLNGVHTAMVARYYGSDLKTVQEILADPDGNRWARDLLYGEILPTLLSSVEGAVEFVDQTLQRFANPYLCHLLKDIRLNHEQKVPVRLVPTADDYQVLFGIRPPLLQAAIDKVVPE